MEGADIIMVKPALPYLDIISDAAELAPDHPLACYQVSGEFAMVHAGAAAGVYDLKTMAFETTESMVRAGEWIELTFQPSLICFKRRHPDTILLHPRLFGLAGGITAA